jgi:E3 ubiquitin-protein ligase RNF115/126
MFDNDFNDLDVGLSISVIESMNSEIVVDDIVCSICLENIQIGTSAKVIPNCLHKFHEDCIKPWLINNAICPYCRRNVVLDNANK